MKSRIARLPRCLSAGAGIAALAAAMALGGCGRAPSRRLPGYVEAEFVYVAPQLPGRLEKLHVRRGGTVAAGAPLFELERESETATRREAEHRLEKARASLTRAEADFQRAEKLFANRVISSEEYDRLRALRSEAQSEAAAADASLKQAQWQFDQKSVTSPAAALVHDTLYREGEWIAAGKPALVLLPPENLKVRFFVDEPRLSSIRHGMAVRVFPDGAAPLEAPVTFISPQAEFTPPVIFSRDQRRRLVFMIELSLPAALAGHLRPGQPLDVELPEVLRPSADKSLRQ